MQLFAKFKKILRRGIRATLNFQKFKVALNPKFWKLFPATLSELGREQKSRAATEDDPTFISVYFLADEEGRTNDS